MTRAEDLFTRERRLRRAACGYEYSKSVAVQSGQTREALVEKARAELRDAAIAFAELANELEE